MHALIFKGSGKPRSASLRTGMSTARTPTTVRDLPSSEMDFPITWGSPPKRSCHKWRLRITTSGSVVFFVRFVEHATVAGLNAEGIEKSGGDHGAFDLNWFVIARKIEKRIAVGFCAVGFEGVALGAIFEKVGGRDGAVVTERTVSPRPYEARRILEGQRAKEDGVNDAEDGGVRADAERQRENRDGSKPRRLRQHAQPVSQILPKRPHRRTPEIRRTEGTCPSVLFHP